MIEETFSGYLDNALISDSPAGPATGLSGDWTLVPNSNFYVNKTSANDNAGTGKAVYDRPSDDNGTRTATRSTSANHEIFETDGDLFYASFLIDPARAGGDMTFDLELKRLDGGGALNFSFGIIAGVYAVGNGGVDIKASGGTVSAAEQLVLARIEYGDMSSGPDDNEIITLWVDPLDESSVPVIDGASIDLLSRGGGKVTAVSIRGDQMNGAPAFFDDLRVGSSFEAVSPELLPGDANRDGIVDVSDLGILATNYGTESGALWSNGDFNDDDKVDVIDLGLLATHYGETALMASVPEPSTLVGLFILCLVGLLARARRNR